MQCVLKGINKSEGVSVLFNLLNSGFAQGSFSSQSRKQGC